jgi:MFS family permease
VLLYNALLAGASIAACATFSLPLPFAAMIAILVLGGFFRSLQFTSINALAYAEVPPPRISRATALSAVGQQTSLAAGVAFGALMVELTLWSKGQTAITAGDFPFAFAAVGLIATSSALVFAMLPPHAGAEMADRMPAPNETSDQKVG